MRLSVQQSTVCTSVRVAILQGYTTQGSGSFHQVQFCCLQGTPPQPHPEPVTPFNTLHPLSSSASKQQIRKNRAKWKKAQMCPGMAQAQ